ncbi:pyridine nucleotide-disulfide oxidoreductase domain-containing protein [Nocardia nova SH22a]|uniref:Pyridine nucleotide-disulfide oxidoreductase domain-containing protein n=1 Tax=Nocardia nova SH22a TaxID=1415166 RepID=W5TSW2_9NOCA|nr:NAD(P)/FAD-dependent oxidoreductase [Nocardia nova]AHH22294.1 pyridine nucleotide-disulfide oxidoreductase domain-containing protein [Nocardia nova SH22a]
MTDELNSSCDVVVIGGGAAGLNGALMLARARRSVVVIDSGAPRNAPADGIHGLLGREGMPPAELLTRGQAEVRGYGGRIVTGEVVRVTRDEDDFRVELSDGRTTRARRLLVTTGLVDELPDIAGLRERWGRDVVHCPYCHGWEVRDRAIGVIANGPMAVHGALLFRQWTDDVVLFTHTMAAPEGEAAEKLAARGIAVITGPVAAIETRDDRISGVRLADGTVVGREVITVGSRMVARSEVLRGLGLEAAEHPSGAGEYIPADAMGRTGVPGVWAAGNVTDLTAQVGAAAAGGALAAAHINADLVEEETRLAVEKYRLGFSAEIEAEVAERVAGERGHGI